MSKFVEYKGIISQVKQDQIHVQISGGPGNFNSYSVRPNEITFRNSQAPQKLISVDTKVNVRFENNKLISISIDQDMDIQAFFGKIEEANNESKTFKVSNSIISYNLSYSQLAHIENQPIVQDLIYAYVNHPVLIYFNSESPIEARLLHENWKKTFKLDSFNRNYKNEEENEFFVLKDQRLIPHKLRSSSVYRQGFSQNFSIDTVKNNIGSEVEVFVKELNIWAEVKTSSSLKVVKNSSLDIPSENNFKPSYNTCFPHQSIGRKPIQVYGKRIILSRNEASLYYKENNYLNDIGIVVLGLLEVCYRFPSYEKLRNKLYELFSNSIANYENPKFRELLITVFSIFRKPNELSNLEFFYKVIFEKSVLFEYYARNFIGNEFDFDFISDNFGVCIYFCDSSGKWTTYLPIFNEQPIPVIFFQKRTNLLLLYREETMIFDGYDTKSLEYTFPKDIDEDLLLYKGEKTPDFSLVFSSILNLTNQIANQNFNEEIEITNSIKSITYSLNQLSGLIPQEHRQDCKNSYEKLLQFNFIKKICQKCKCGKEITEAYVCGDHNLCKDCAFFSNRFGYCVICNQVFNQPVPYKDISCSYCGQKFDDIYYSTFSCHCILCTVCIFNIVSGGAQVCYKNHQLQQFDYENSYKYLRKVGYKV